MDVIFPAWRCLFVFPHSFIIILLIGYFALELNGPEEILTTLSWFFIFFFTDLPYDNCSETQVCAWELSSTAYSVYLASDPPVFVACSTASDKRWLEYVGRPGYEAAMVVTCLS